MMIVLTFFTPMWILMMSQDNKMVGYVSSNGIWAAVPWGNKYVSIYNGQQICTHHSLETAKKFIQRENKKEK